MPPAPVRSACIGLTHLYPGTQHSAKYIMFCCQILLTISELLTSWFRVYILLPARCLYLVSLERILSKYLYFPLHHLIMLHSFAVKNWVHLTIKAINDITQHICLIDYKMDVFQSDNFKFCAICVTAWGWLGNSLTM